MLGLLGGVQSRPEIMIRAYEDATCSALLYVARIERIGESCALGRLHIGERDACACYLLPVNSPLVVGYAHAFRMCDHRVCARAHTAVPSSPLSLSFKDRKVDYAAPTSPASTRFSSP